MRIAQVAPLLERVPPTTYGGTERVVAYLVDALVDLGHEVTLFATGDSQTKARLSAATPRASRGDDACRDPLYRHILQLEHVAKAADGFDVVHFHTGFLHLPLAERLETPSVTTLHGRLDIPDLRPLMAAFPDAPLVSISHAQRRPLLDLDLNWIATVYHGLPPRLLAFRPEAGEYAAFVGRISPEKRVDRAIAIARRAGVELRIAAKVDAVDHAYFRSEIEPLLDAPGVRFLGEIGEREKGVLLGGARALLFPIDWPEPFGMVVIEALSCGTPVIAWNHGSVPELIEPGVNGWVVDSIEAGAEALRRTPEISRRACRRSLERRFLAERMARDYLAVYAAVRGRTGARLEGLSA
jgi:glycosyltransferase involved in cell wall biosynthesis